MATFNLAIRTPNLRLRARKFFAVMSTTIYGKVLASMHLDSYISGFVDGEGCFCVSFQPSIRHSLGWEVRPSFSVSQNADRAQLLYVIKEKWNCGSIRPDRSDKTVKFEVRNLSELVSIVVPHFQANPMMSSKQNDFTKFAHVCELMSNGKHRAVAGFRQIVRLSMEMNPSGKRKYRSDELLVSLPLAQQPHLPQQNLLG